MLTVTGSVTETSVASAAGTIVMAAPGSTDGLAGAPPPSPAGPCHVAAGALAQPVTSSRASPATAEPTVRVNAERGGLRMTFLPDTSRGPTVRVARLRFGASTRSTCPDVRSTFVVDTPDKKTRSGSPELRVRANPLVARPGPAHKVVS